MLMILSTGSLAASSREVYSLNDGWLFFFKQEADSDDARHITLPHTWNLDATASDGVYLQTTANYTRELYIPEEWRGRRLFVRFDGVQSVADIFLNGRHVGEHRGGWTAFTFEITDKVAFGANNTLLAVVSNAYRNDVLPTSSDMNLYGGIYRGVELIATSQNIISPLHFSSDGVMVTTSRLTAERAEGNIDVYLSAPKETSMNVNVRIFSPSGKSVFAKSVRAAKVDPARPLAIPFTIDNPSPWSCDDPQLYRVCVTVGDEQSPSDEVCVRTGLRRISIGDDNRLRINDSIVDVHGVNMAHDRAGVGSAMRTRHYDEDLSLVADLGANALRSLTAPHDSYLYDRCDELGLMVWIDAPLTRAQILSDISYFSTDMFRANGREQLQEIIYQNYNHPSVVMWGIFSQLWQKGDDPLPYVRELNALAKRIDPTRPTVACSDADGDLNFVTDLVVLRQNIGWYRGTPDDVAVWCTQLAGNPAWSKLHYGVCYGEGGSIDQQTDQYTRAEPRPNTRWLPERRQTAFHERYAANIGQSGIFWGVWIDNMFDYGSSRRAYGQNQAGLMTFDHKDKKDAYYLYRALWNRRQPTLYISERRWNMRQDSIQQFKIYSSEQMPLLLVGGDTVAVREVAPCQYLSDSVVMHNYNRVESRTGKLADSIGVTIDNALKSRRQQALRTSVSRK